MTCEAGPLYLLNPVFNTPTMQEAIDSFLPLWLDRHQPVHNSELFHYTTLPGMRGILTERAIWCGHASTLNDPLEIQYGRHIVTDIISEAMKSEESQDVRIFLSKLSVEVESFGKNLLHAFMACFCESGNLLSQWRVYADRGGGYCLGFQFASTTLIASGLKTLDEATPPFLRQVIYEEKTQRDLVHKYLSRITAAAKKAFASATHDKPYQAAVMAMQAANVVLDMIVSFKHPAFIEEREWRLIRVTSESHEPESLRFREVGGQLVPYKATHIFDREAGQLLFPLRSITFGPSLEPVRTYSAIELLLHHVAADRHPIMLSTTPEIRGAGYSMRQT